MTKRDVMTFMNRIKQHYQEFLIDDGKCEEWYRELKDYNTHEVNEKFEEHLRNENYCSQIPRIGFLIKYLIKEKDKATNNANTIRVKCSQCGKGMLLTEYDKHIERCNSVEYLNLQSLRFTGKELDKEKYRQMDEETFNKIYDKVLNKILETTTDEEEKQNIMNYFLGVE